MSKTEFKYRHALVLLNKKLDRMIQYEKKQIAVVGLDEYLRGYHRGREVCLSDIRDDVERILNNIKEES